MSRIMSSTSNTDHSAERPTLRLDLYFDSAAPLDAQGTLSRLAEFASANGPQIRAKKDLVELAGNIYDARRLRARFLSVSMLGEPVWDMLLALYCFTARGEALSVSGLCHAAGVPPTTALRWANLLEQKKLIDRTRDARDARRAIVSLSADGEALMSNYLTAIHGGVGG